MAKQVKLTAQSRQAIGRPAVKKLKAQGIVPATIYGGKDAPQNLQVASRDIAKLLAHTVGENILVDLEIENNGKKENRLVLIQEVQRHVISRNVLHVDFHTVSVDETITTSIPLESIGDATGVKNSGGLLEQSLRSLEIECLPKDLPEIIKVDISALEIDDAIHVKDLKLPEGVAALTDEDLTVFSVAEPTVAEPEPTGEVAPTEPEVIKEKKPEPVDEPKKK